MRRLAILIVPFALLGISTSASADWRWAPPHFQKHRITYYCDTMICVKQTYIKERNRYHRKLVRYNKRRLHEWNHWAHLYIPLCTWYGESGYGPQFSPVRYVTPNSQGSGAYGKYQFMSGTYHSVAKYHDWSPLDQEIAGHREYWRAGTSPWTNC